MILKLGKGADVFESYKTIIPEYLRTDWLKRSTYLWRFMNTKIKKKKTGIFSKITANPFCRMPDIINEGEWYLII